MSNLERRFALIEGYTGEIVKHYTSLDNALQDCAWKDPSCFFIGDCETMKGYHIDEFIKLAEGGVFNER